jgi:hypothetical protein
MFAQRTFFSANELGPEKSWMQSEYNTGLIIWVFSPGVPPFSGTLLPMSDISPASAGWGTR